MFTQKDTQAQVCRSYRFTHRHTHTRWVTRKCIVHRAPIPIHPNLPLYWFDTHTHRIRRPHTCKSIYPNPLRNSSVTLVVTPPSNDDDVFPGALSPGSWFIINLYAMSHSRAPHTSTHTQTHKDAPRADIDQCMASRTHPVRRFGHIIYKNEIA